MNNIDINSRLLSGVSVSKVSFRTQSIILMYSKLLGDMKIGIKLDKSDKMLLNILIYIPVTFVVRSIDLTISTQFLFIRKSGSQMISVLVSASAPVSNTYSSIFWRPCSERFQFLSEPFQFFFSLM